MLISFTVSPEHAEELMTVLPLIIKGKSDAQLTVSKDTEEFHTVDVNFEDEHDPTPWQAVRLVMAAIELEF